MAADCDHPGTLLFPDPRLRDPAGGLALHCKIATFEGVLKNLAQDNTKIPKPLPLPSGKSVQSYPLLPVDGFVLSRIDGTISIPEIVSLTGLDDATVMGSIEKLASLGLIEMKARAPAPRSLPPPKGTVSTRSPSIPPHPVTEISEVLDSGAPKPKRALYDPAELDEDVDLERDHRTKILDAFYQLDELDHYQLLGVARTDDKKVIKRAYYELASLHHPDRFFRKRLGSFKQKMEAVFSRITEAHDILADKAKRADYDAYLAAQDEARALEAQLSRRTSSPGMDRADSRVVPPVTPPPPPTREARTSGIQLSEQVRRDAFARRLLGGRGMSSTPAPPQAAANPPPPDPDALRRHYEQKITAVRTHMAKEHLASAEQAAAGGDWVAATTAYRLAVGVSPDDDVLQRKLVEAQTNANAVLAEAYRKQAAYEEKSDKPTEAARSWQRVTKVLPDDPEAYSRAAKCLLLANTDLRVAGTLAQRAVALEPKRLEHRIVLAEIYLAAGLSLNARRELEAAARLAPDDANIEALLKRAGKG